MSGPLKNTFFCGFPKVPYFFFFYESDPDSVNLIRNSAQSFGKKVIKIISRSSWRAKGCGSVSLKKNGIWFNIHANLRSNFPIFKVRIRWKMTDSNSAGQKIPGSSASDCGSGLRLTGSGSDPPKKNPDPIVKKSRTRHPARGGLEHILCAVHCHQRVQTKDDTIWIRILNSNSNTLSYRYSFPWSRSFRGDL